MYNYNLMKHILQRIDSRHLAKLWSFYRNYFSDDTSCLQFLYASLENEPVNDGTIYHEAETGNKLFMNNQGATINDSDFIPRRMLNAVERLVTAARDMEQIRRGKDVFKIIYLVTCVETLQLLKKTATDVNGSANSKKEILFDFFEKYVEDKDRIFIKKNFSHDDEDHILISGLHEQEDSFQQFIGVINEYRNCAAHEGEYWEFCFANNIDGYPTLLTLNIDLEHYSRKNKREHCFRSTISYKNFEDIFVRTCIHFIRSYVIERNMRKASDE